MSLSPANWHAKEALNKIPREIWALGFVSMLMDISSELIHSLLPVFMVSFLGASAFTIGLIEGTAEATALIVKVFSGALSDYLGKRKALAVIGYGLGAASKPLFAVAASVGLVFTARIMDRIGKGIRGAPRDALVADLAPPDIRGAAFGLRQSLDTVGAFTGPLLAIILMIRWKNDFQSVFWIAVLPGLLSVIVLLFGVKENERPASARRINPINWRELTRLGRPYWLVVAIGSVFTLARFSEAFLVLQAQQIGLPIAWVPVIMIAMNVIYALSAYPVGRLSDRMSSSKLLSFGLIVLIVSDLVLALSDSIGLVFLGSALWGLHMGATQGLLARMVADAAPADLRGTAFGFFNLLCGLAMLIASALAGLLWDWFGAAYTFYTGALFSGLALAGMALSKN
jgi:MFS family permease